MTRGPGRTTACSRRPPAFATLRLPGAAEAQRAASYTSHQGACNQSLMAGRSYEERLKVDAINQALLLSPYPHIRDVYNVEGAALGLYKIYRSPRSSPQTCSRPLRAPGAVACRGFPHG